MMKSFVLLLALTALTASGAQAQNTGQTNAAPPKPAAKSNDLFADLVVAKGKGVEVKRSQLDEALINIKANYATRGQALPPDQVALMEQRILERLIQLQLLLTRSTDADKAKAREMVDKRLADAKERSGEENFNRQIKATGMSLDEIRSKMVEEATAEAAVKRELPVNVTEVDAKKYYDENTSKFEHPEMVRASHVLISTKDPNDPNPNLALRKDLPDEQKAAKRKQAEDVLKRARAGEDFAKLAKDHSDDQGSKDKGGEYTFGRGQMMKEFEAAAFSLNTNQISDLVTTLYGYHIIKLSEKIPAKNEPFTGPDTKATLALGQTAPIRDILTEEALQKQFKPYYEKLKKDADIQILDEKLKPREAPAEGAVKPEPTNPAPKK